MAEMLKKNVWWHYRVHCLFVFFPFGYRSVKSHGAFIQVFHFKLEETEGSFILGWATKNSRKLARLATKD